MRAKDAVTARRLPRTTPDYFPVTVLNAVLGGQFSSRINLNLREDKGYTYGARSSFDFLRGPGPFSAGASVHDSSSLGRLHALGFSSTAGGGAEASAGMIAGGGALTSGGGGGALREQARRTSARRLNARDRLPLRRRSR